MTGDYWIKVWDRTALPVPHGVTRAAAAHVWALTEPQMATGLRAWRGWISRDDLHVLFDLPGGLVLQRTRVQAPWDAVPTEASR